MWLRTFVFKALIAIFWDLQSLRPSLTKPDTLRFRCSSGHVLSKTKSVTPQFFYISDITNSSSFNGKMFRKKSVLENFRANVLKPISFHVVDICPCPHLIPVCLTIMYWYFEEKIFFGHTWRVQEQNKGTYILWTFLHFNIILSLGRNKNICERLEMTGW